MVIVLNAIFNNISAIIIVEVSFIGDIIVLPISSRSELLNPLEQNLLLTSGQRRTFDNSNLTNIDDSHLGRTDRIW
jgi:hypothetical protein